MTNVFKIRHGKETHVYRTESSSEKKNLLSQFRQVAEELAAKRRKEREGEHERRKSLWAGGDVSGCLTLTLIPQTDTHLDSVHRFLSMQKECQPCLIGWPILRRELVVMVQVRKRKRNEMHFGQVNSLMSLLSLLLCGSGTRQFRMSNKVR